MDIAGLVSYVAGFFDWIFTFLTDGIVDLLTDFTNWLMVKLTVLYIDTKISTLKLGWSIASGVLEQLNVGPVVSSYVSSLDPSIGYVANTIGLFDSFNMVMHAGVSSFVIRTFKL